MGIKIRRKRLSSQPIRIRSQIFKRNLTVRMANKYKNNKNLNYEDDDGTFSCEKQTTQGTPTKHVFYPDSSELQESKRFVCKILRDLFGKTNYSTFTYFCCLDMLARLYFMGTRKICFLMASTLFVIAAKFYENMFARPFFSGLSNWSQYEFTPQQMLETEAQILQQIDFKIPQMQDLEVCSEEEVYNLCLQLEDGF